MIQAIELINTTTNGTGSIIRDAVPGGAFQATINGTGEIACVATIQISLDTENWLTLGTITLKGTNVVTDGFTSVGSWYVYRAVISEVSGTISSIRVNMSSVT